MIWTEEVKGQDAELHGQNFRLHTSTRGSESEEETVNKPDRFTCGSGDEDEYSEPDEDDGEAGSAFT